MKTWKKLNKIFQGCTFYRIKKILIRKRIQSLFNFQWPKDCLKNYENF